MRLASEIIAELAMEARDLGRLEVIAEHARSAEEHDIVGNAIHRCYERIAELLDEHGIDQAAFERGYSAACSKSRRLGILWGEQ